MTRLRRTALTLIEKIECVVRALTRQEEHGAQNFLELFRADYNLRTRRWGRHKDTSPHECLTGSPVNDWLSLIGFPPSSTATVH